MNDLQPVALEHEGATADAVVANGRIYCSNRRELLERDVAIVGDRIAALLEDAESVIGEQTTVIDAADRIVLPGLIDAHTHADLQVVPERAVSGMLESGTTSIVTETSGLGLLLGDRGVEIILERTAELPVTAYFTLPPQRFADTFEPPRGDDTDFEAFVDRLSDERVVGIGEIGWIHVVGRESPIERLCERAREVGAEIVGHGAGCRGDSLRAFATVVDNDHEAIAADGVRERAANGLHVVGRCGSNRDDIDALAEAFPEIDRGSVSLSTDGVWPDDLRDGVGMADVVRRAIDAGIPKFDAIDAATRNPAEEFGLEGRGVIAPGATADLLVVDDLESMAVETVLSDGDPVVTDGTVAVELPAASYPDAVTDTISVDVARDTFTAPHEAASEGVVRAMAVGQGLVTTETTAKPAVDGTGAGDGTDRDRLGPDPESGVLTATLLDRDPATDDRAFTGFLTGFGLETGAVATSATWEQPGVAVVAADTDDAVVATERVESMGGGFAVVRDGTVVADVSMPVGAIAAEAPLEETIAGFEDVETALREAGVDVDRPLLTLQTLTFPGVPALKLTASGYADILGRTTVGLEPE